MKSGEYGCRVVLGSSKTPRTPFRFHSDVRFIQRRPSGSRMFSNRATRSAPSSRPTFASASDTWACGDAALDTPRSTAGTAAEDELCETSIPLLSATSEGR
jgi:hypothetical protein